MSQRIIHQLKLIKINKNNRKRFFNDYKLKMENSDQMAVTFIAPKSDKAKTMHFILEVTDDGAPSLTRYQRVIVNVLP